MRPTFTDLTFAAAKGVEPKPQAWNTPEQIEVKNTYSATDPACRPDLEAQGIKKFINVKSNVLETLKEYQRELGIK
jgi:hypothetical protein